MINSMNENLMRSAMKTDPTIQTQDRHLEMRKNEQVKNMRPIEESQAGRKAETNEHQDDLNTRFVVEDNKIVFEKYNKDGDVIIRLPPSYLPVDELA